MRRLSYRRGIFVSLVVFVAVFSFVFLSRQFNSNEDALATDLTKFDPGYIMSDYQMSNYNSMSEAEIQNFLTAKNSCPNTDYDYYLRLSASTNAATWHFKNGHFVCLSEELFGDGEVIGSGETAAHIIWQAAQDFQINPQVLIVLLQKENSLITDPIPNSFNYRTAAGYGCPDTAACSSKYYGFKNQVRNAAALFHEVLSGGWTNYPLGENFVKYSPHCSSGSVVNIRSLATSALYRYTPYQPNSLALSVGYGVVGGSSYETCAAYGNRNFYSFFEDWFGGITVSKNITAPRNIVAKSSGDSITISWDAPSDANIYGKIDYEVVLADSKRNEIKATVSGDVYEYSFEKLGDGDYIAASVMAVTSSGSAYGRITFDLAIGELPGKPVNLVAEKYNGGVRVSWDAPNNNGGLDIEKYVVVLADVDKNEIVLEVDGDKNEAIFYGLAMNEYFATSVMAKNAKGGQYERITFSIRTYGDFSESGFYEGFSDMPSDEISKKAVSWAVLNGITDKNDVFNGEKALTRRQAMVLLWRLAGKPEVELYEGFSDMPSDEISKKAVSWAVLNGITDKNDVFNGEKALTRRQAMVILRRFYFLIVA